MKRNSTLSQKKIENNLELYKNDFVRNKYLYLMMIPGLLFYIIFHYVPMYGVVIAFKDFSVGKGILGSDWVGFKHFVKFFSSYFSMRIIKNTFLLSFYSIVWGFPAPIILALLLNEVSSTKFKKAVQTITYLPHFISMVVICGMIVDFTSRSGIISTIIARFTGEPQNLLMHKEYFRTIYITSDIWQGVGWGTIIYLAALTNIDPQLYEAAKIDGAGKFKQLTNVTLPGIMPTIIIMLILRIGRIMSIGFEKVFLLYNPSIYETADIISTYVYRVGLIQADYSYSVAVGLFNALINLILIVTANYLSRKYNETSLW